MSNQGILTPALALTIPGSTPIASGAWTQLTASLAKSAAGFQIINTTNRIIRIGVGGSGQEQEIPFYVGPGVTSPVISQDFTRGSRISARALGADTSSGDLVVNFLG